MVASRCRHRALVRLVFASRLAGGGLRLLIEERDVVVTVTHPANVVIRARKTSRCSLFIPMFPLGIVRIRVLEALTHP